MYIPKHIVEQIYQQVDILEVIGDYVQLKRKGHYYIGFSPFKTERTPSFTVTPSKGIFKCFSTGKGGNAISFLMEIEGYNYQEALQSLAEKYHIEIEYEDNEESKAVSVHRESLLIINQFAVDFFRKELLKNNTKPLLHDFISKRGLIKKILDDFQIGFGSDQFNAFSKAALKAGYKDKYLVELGLSIATEKNDDLYDRFHHRVIFPLHDISGKVIGFSGRVIDPDSKKAKYINSPQSLLYEKSNYLFGLFFAKIAIKELNECILTEGYLDVISLMQEGIKNVVANCGTALTDNQVLLIKRYTKNVLLIYDSDEAGVKASLKAIELILSAGMNVRLVQLPKGEDPDSYIKKHKKEGFLDYCQNNALNFTTFIINHYSRNYSIDDPLQKSEIINQLASVLALIPNDLQYSLFVDHASKELNISPDLLKGSIQKIKSFQSVKEQKLKKKSQEVIPKAETKVAQEVVILHSSERELLRLLLNYYDKILKIEYVGEDEQHEFILNELIIEEIGEIPFKHVVYERVRKVIIQSYHDETQLPLNTLLSSEDNEIRNLVSELLTSQYHLSEAWKSRGIYIPDMDEDLSESVQNSLTHFQLKLVNQLIKQNQEHIKKIALSENLDDKNIEKVLVRKMKLESIRKEITSKLGIVVLY